MTNKPTVVELLHKRTGAVLFRHTAEDNSVKKTLELAIRERVKLSNVDLSKADLSDANLEGLLASDADMSHALLHGANLRGARLNDLNGYYANFNGADLSEARLSSANLTHASFFGAKLVGASMCYGNLRYADFRSANAYKIDLSDAILLCASLYGADLTKADLWSVVGDGSYIKSLQIGGYEVAYTSEVLQIGCQNFPIKEWWEMDDDAIERLDNQRALDWWAKYRDLIKDVIETSPAVPLSQALSF